jgi:hypothetical protein
METTAVGSYRLKVRLGAHEFDAEGEKDSVNEQFALFLQAVNSVPAQSEAKVNGKASRKDDDNEIRTEDFAATEAILNRAFKAKDEQLSLNVLPQSKFVNADSIMLLLYGYQEILKKDSVQSTDLMDSAKQSGLRIDRLDRALPADYLQFVIKGGSGKGTRYSLNNRGLQYSQEQLERMFD